MKKFISFSFFLYIGVIYIIFCITFWAPIFFLVRGKNKYKNAKKIKFLWSKWMSFLAGIKLETVFLFKLDLQRKYIICANHKSYLDILLMYQIIDQDFAFLGKSSTY